MQKLAAVIIYYVSEMLALLEEIKYLKENSLWQKAGEKFINRMINELNNCFIPLKLLRFDAILHKNDKLHSILINLLKDPSVRSVVETNGRLKQNLLDLNLF